MSRPVLHSLIIGLLVGGLLARTQFAGAQQAAPVASVSIDTIAEARRLIAAKAFPDAIALLEPFSAHRPANGLAMLVLAGANQQSGQTASAIRVYQQAAALPTRAATPAAQALFGLYASTGQGDSAYRWLGKLTGIIDLTQVAATPGLEALHDDPRFALLFPDRSTFNPPFRETGTRIIHEWQGEAAGDEFGWIARGLGDVDGDRVTDVVVSATTNPPYAAATGKLYVYSGKSGRLLWTQIGEKGALLGFGVESAGDVDGDGRQDVIAGAPGLNAAFVYSGRDGRQLLRLAGDTTDVDLGMAVAGVGDLDGDGRPDVVVGAPSSRSSGVAAGRVYFFSGRDGHRLAARDGVKEGETFGTTVGGSAGHVIIGAGAGGESSHGRVYIFDQQPTPRFIREADSSGIALGNMFVSVVGDVDRDGTPDFYATDFANSANGAATGRVYIYSGKTGETIRTFTGDGPGQGFGIGAARTGDLNGDGAADLLVGAWQYSGAAWSGGRVQAISGKDGAILQTITGQIPGETLGFDAVGVGDIDGDGRTDFLITSAWSMVNGFRSGRVYIVAGTVSRART